MTRVLILGAGGHFEADPSTRRPKNQENQAHLRPEKLVVNQLLAQVGKGTRDVTPHAQTLTWAILFDRVLLCEQGRISSGMGARILGCEMLDWA